MSRSSILFLELPYLLLDSCCSLNWLHALPGGCVILNLTPKPDPPQAFWASCQPAQEAPPTASRLSPAPVLDATPGRPAASWGPSSRRTWAALSTCCPPVATGCIRSGKRTAVQQGGFVLGERRGLQRTKWLLSQPARWHPCARGEKNYLVNWYESFS